MSTNESEYIYFQCWLNQRRGSILTTSYEMGRLDSEANEEV